MADSLVSRVRREEAERSAGRPPRTRSLVDEVRRATSPTENLPRPGEETLSRGAFPDPQTLLGDPERAGPQPTSTAERKARLFARDLPRGAAETVDFLGRVGRSAVPAGARAVFGLDEAAPFSEPALSPEAMERAVSFGERASGLSREEPARTFGEKVLSAAGEETGAALVTGPLMAARAARLGRLGPDLALEAGSIGGASVGRASTAESGETAQILAGVFGGLGGQATVATGRAVANVPINALDRAGVRVPGRASERRAAENLQALVGDRQRALDRLDEMEQLRSQGVPVPRIPLGAAVNDPSLLRAEASRARPGEQMLAFEEARRAGNVSLRENAIALGAPRNGDVDAASAAARLHVQTTLDEANLLDEADRASFAAAQDVQQQAVRRSLTAAGAGPEVNASDISTAARSELDRLEAETFAPFRDNANARTSEEMGVYQRIAAEAEFAGAQFSARNTFETAQSIASDAGRFGQDTVPVRVLSEMTGLAPPGAGENIGDFLERAKELLEPSRGKLPFSELRGLLQRINRELDSSAISEAKRPHTRNLMRLKTAVQADLDAADDLGTAPGIATQLRIANEQFHAASEEWRRKGTATGRMFRKSGAAPVEPSQTLGLYFRPSSPERAREFNRIARRSPELQSQMRRYIVQTAYEATANADGSVNADRLARWAARHRTPLREFPEAHALIANTTKLGQTASAMGFGGGRRLRPEVERSAVSVYAEDPQKAVRRILRNDDVSEALRLRNLVKDDPDALAGLRRSFWDEIVTARFRQDVIAGSAGEAAGDATLALNSRAIRRTLETSPGVVDALFGSGHRQRLETILQVQDAVDRIPAGGSLGNVGGAKGFIRELMTSGVVLSEILSPFRRVVKGAQLRSRFLSRLTDAQAQALLDEATWDPQLARLLLTRVVPQNVGMIEKRLRSNLVSLGFRIDAREGRSEEEERQQ